MMILNVIVLSLALILIFWIFLEYIGYVPNDKTYIIDSFISKISYKTHLPIPFNVTNNNSLASVNQEGTRDGITKTFQNLNSHTNDTVLRNVRYDKSTGRILSNNMELTFSQMNKLAELLLAKQNKININKDKNEAKYNKLNDSDLINIQYILLHFIYAINKEYLYSSFVFDKTQFNPFKILAHKFISGQDIYINNNLATKKYNLNIQIGNPYKTHTFLFVTEIIFINNEQIVITKLELIGTPIMYNNAGGLFEPDKYGEEELDKDGLIKGDIVQGTSYKCFNPKEKESDGELKYTDKQHCTSYHKEINSLGVWDRPCKSNDECPYFNTNKNYPNQFGKCMENGKCEMPIGIETIGYRQISSGSEPLCYNCPPEMKNNGNHKCCNLQENPDYMYQNDLNVREKHKDILESKGLLVSHPL